ncbi:diaminopimelate epimerase [Peribacillus saganii]|uniref:Diaminopimelate epimerase n=1 Tax=Peribacillus saganii TaxID=2303992 RepID=A0A372LK64_9BACI|nr:diaminopimelate epimerase [Peribacillus saganii]RFU66416.1 diaminopimelate epimerase [Peribacillus saganii]
MNIELVKCHGSGNDFIIIDEMEGDISFNEDERSSLAMALCSRTSLLGADGILFVMPSEQSHARMRVFNADGSEASMCGNGLRCVARYASDKLRKSKLIIETMKANLAVEKTEEIFDGIPTFKVEISPVSFNVKDLPLNLSWETLKNERIVELSDTLLFTALAVPNPHLVSIVESDVLKSSVQKDIATLVNGPNDLFPDGVNVSFVHELKKGHIFVRTFERGVGFTNACGTAMSASSLVTCLNGLNETEKEISVYNDGGMVKCMVHQQNGRYQIDLIGNGTYEYRAEIEVNPADFQNFKLVNKEIFEEETSKYAKLQEYAKQFVSEHMK